MRKIYFYLLTLLAWSMFAVSCEQAQDLEAPGSSQTNSGPVAPGGDSSPLCFTLQIEGGDYSVGIVDRLVTPEKVTIVTASMCPYTYFYTIPSGMEPDMDAIEIIATNSSMRYIRGFCDQYGCYSHADTYHYAYFWNRPETLTAIFEPTNYRPDPLPPGVDDNTSKPDVERAVDVTISMERLGGAFDLTAHYTDINQHSITTGIGSYTTLYNVSTKKPLSIEVRNTTEYAGQLTFYSNGTEKVVRLGRHSSETVNYSFKDVYGSCNIRIY